MQKAITPEADERVRHYETDVRCDSHYADLPSKVRFAITESDAHRILRLAELISENGLHQIEKYDYRASWLEGEDPSEFLEVSSDADRLHVTSSEFWFSGYVKHTSAEMYSQRQDLKSLAEWFGIKKVEKNEAKSPSRPRVLVVIDGGVGQVVSDSGIEVELFDWDNFKDDPKSNPGVPDHFADLAEPLGVPIGDSSKPAATQSQ